MNQQFITYSSFVEQIASVPIYVLFDILNSLQRDGATLRKSMEEIKHTDPDQYTLWYFAESEKLQRNSYSNQHQSSSSPVLAQLTNFRHAINHTYNMMNAINEMHPFLYSSWYYSKREETTKNQTFTNLTHLGNQFNFLHHQKEELERQIYSISHQTIIQAGNDGQIKMKKRLFNLRVKINSVYQQMDRIRQTHPAVYSEWHNDARKKIKINVNTDELEIVQSNRERQQQQSMKEGNQICKSGLSMEVELAVDADTIKMDTPSDQQQPHSINYQNGSSHSSISDKQVDSYVVQRRNGHLSPLLPTSSSLMSLPENNNQYKIMDETNQQWLSLPHSFIADSIPNINNFFMTIDMEDVVDSNHQSVSITIGQQPSSLQSELYIDTGQLSISNHEYC